MWKTKLQRHLPEYIYNVQKLVSNGWSGFRYRFSSFCSQFFVLSSLFLRNFCNTAVAEMCRSRPNLVFSHSAGKFPSTSGFQAKEVLRISIETKGSAFELEASMLCPIRVQQRRRMPEP